MLSLRNNKYSSKLDDDLQLFGKEISPSFQFEQKDIERLRNDMSTLVTNLEPLYQEQQKGETHLISCDDDDEDMQIVVGGKGLITSVKSGLDLNKLDEENPGSRVGNMTNESNDNQSRRGGCKTSVTTNANLENHRQTTPFNRRTERDGLVATKSYLNGNAKEIQQSTKVDIVNKNKTRARGYLLPLTLRKNMMKINEKNTNGSVGNKTHEIDKSDDGGWVNLRRESKINDRVDERKWKEPKPNLRCLDHNITNTTTSKYAPQWAPNYQLRNQDKSNDKDVNQKLNKETNKDQHANADMMMSSFQRDVK